MLATDPSAMFNKEMDKNELRPTLGPNVAQISHARTTCVSKYIKP